ncbi:MAG TPA: hypothetical protein VLL08_06945 [Kineosporiaceae bacterium]|nr:hypothetical protein [Kineosporiaceae bacterium]
MDKIVPGGRDHWVTRGSLQADIQLEPLDQEPVDFLQSEKDGAARCRGGRWRNYFAARFEGLAFDT